MADGWSELGAALAGGNPAQQEQSFQTGMLRGAQAQDVLAQARLRRDQEMARQQINPAAFTPVISGIDPNTGRPFDPVTKATLEANLVSSFIRSGGDPRQLSGYLDQTQNTGFKNQAWQAATAANPDVNQLNRELMVIGGKPVELSKVEGNVTLNPMQTPDSQTINPTQIGLADIMLKGAQAGAANASAAERKAQAARAYAGINADKAANYDIVDTGNGLARVSKLPGGPAATIITDANGKPVIKATASSTSPSLPPVGDLSAAFGTDLKTGKVDPDAVSKFMSYQQQQAAADPRFNNGSFALSQYMLNKPIGSGLGDAADSSDTHPSLADRFLASLPNGIPSDTGNPVSAPAANLSSAAPSAAPPAAVAAPALPQPKSKADYDALPAGAQYIYTDGSIRVKGG